MRTWNRYYMTTKAEIIREFRAAAPPKPVIKTVLDEYAPPCKWQEYVEKYTKIKRKGYGIVSWKANKAQQKVWDILVEHNFENCVIIILKLRQETGMTTACMNIAAKYAQTFPGRNVKSYFQDWDTAKDKWEDIVRVTYDYTPVNARLQNTTDNERTLAFTNRSRYQVQPAKGQKGRAGTVDFLHLSEAAFYDDLGDWWTAVESSLADNAVLIIESTPNGYNLFREWYYAAKEKHTGFEKWNAMFFPVTDFFDMENPEHVAFLEEKKARLKEKYPQEYPMDDVSCFIASSSGYLDGHMLSLYMRAIEEGRYPLQRFDFVKTEEGMMIEPNRYGELHIFKRPYRDEKIPSRNHKYIIGGDVAEGKEGGDWSVLLVLDRLTDEFVAMYRAHCSENDLVDYANALGRYYNNALMAIENNKSGHVLMGSLIRLHDYPEIYYDIEIEKVKTGKSAPEPGIRTTAKTKPMHFGAWQLWIRDGIIVIPFREVISEAFSLIKKDGKIEAESGCNDDTQIAGSKAVWIHQTNPYVIPVDKPVAPEGSIAEFKVLNKNKSPGRSVAWRA